ncbi:MULTISPECIES: GMC family oxidoreductase [unclassified Halomonas]|uniref:GMC oxidoreductase n=1 Tax=unclassified Halomonas TaxID=2609666 RepID=UPI0007DA2461|nr:MULTISPECIES: GMC family oxidoreductase [unclassified Halomonas]MBT2785111.1 GMC family oxidoreductase [Halomonas sp. ISL-106]MBT2796805.1 GMC family oxidoreductase [Halomonas sp. ISL-104]OAL60031.1 GMC oxidoreductase [Halomonas sp. ALS9]
MYIDFKDISEHTDSWDVCIIGAGAAGISMAVTLAGRGHRVLLCEGGDADYSERSQECYKGEVVGDPYIPLYGARLRHLGGSTNHWGGICRPLDRYDFNAKAAASETAWPIGRDALAPYYSAAVNTLGLEPTPDDHLIPDAGLKRIYFSLGHPTRMKEKHAATLSDSTTLECCLTANLVALETHDGAVTNATFSNYQGDYRKVQARYFVLACGGIENSRLLLWCNQQLNGQLIPQADTLGRYWMEHPHATVGKALLFEPAALGLDDEYNVFLSPTADAINARQILNCGLRLHRMNPEATQELADELADQAPTLAGRLRVWQAQGRVIHGAVVRAAWEQEPRYDNRIELSDELDKLGVPRSRLVWRQSELDRRTIRESMLLLGEYLRDNEVGRLQLADWLADTPVQLPTDGELAGRHHMGGTRMSLNAEEGIVNADCRLFAQDNFYVAGSSVFASAGHANPTLTLVQLALRLCDHLEDRLTQSA